MHSPDHATLHEHAHLSAEQEIALLGTRSYEQYRVMRQRFERQRNEHDTCSFCLLDPSLNSPLTDQQGTPLLTTSWNVWHNPFAHTHTATHIVAAPKRHLRYLYQLDDQEWADLRIISTYVGTNYFGGKGGGTIVREGALAYNAGTVPHLHVNFVVPDLTGHVSATLAKDPDVLYTERLRMIAFAKRYAEEPR